MQLLSAFWRRISRGERHVRPCVMDALEGRTLLSTTLFDITSKGTLIVSGTTAAESITVEVGLYGVLLTVRGGDGEVAEHGFNRSQVKRVRVDAAGGRDKILVQGYNNLPATLLGGNGDDYIRCHLATGIVSGGAGDDFIDAGRLTPALRWGRVQPLVVADGGIPFGDDLILPPGHAAYEGLTVHGAAGNDTIVGSPGQDTISGGTGTDTIRVPHLPIGNVVEVESVEIVDDEDDGDDDEPGIIVVGV